MKATKDWADIIGGLLLLVGGIWFMSMAAGQSMGTLRRMGPGYMPMAIGVLVVLFGLLVAVPALFRGGALPVPEWRPFVTICLSVLAFALVVEKFGLVPATVVLTVVAAFAEPRLRPLQLLLLCAALSAIGVGVFVKGLGIPVAAFRWPV
ncbi:tripartite tricarboxylate transporter TctB family protein [Roseomonas sp. 18066]|uniref:tripartite tricarboxylate transporter TctB family protein n=1 Tax=Roseomonas sp. 18066 TaxID=2681412 RepID=UPI00135C282F|nr:tripartite tricarboxylate transporter TctB family protein [Roseomonas sp. 18066]